MDARAQVLGFVQGLLSVLVNAFASVITLEQFNEQTNSVHKISLSMAQLRDLQAALDLPEGSYQFRREEP